MSTRNSLLSRSSLMSVALFAAGALSVVGYGYITKEDAVKAVPAAGTPERGLAALAVPTGAATAGELGGSGSAERSTNNEAAAGNDATASSAATAHDEALAAVTPEAVAGWVAQATGTDANKRSAAIDALAHAPKAAAVPVLAQVLETANESDRPRALRSLRTLAQRQGDEDDRIRSVVRKIVFHDGDESAVQTAQATLDDIEQDLSQATVKR